MSSATPVQAPLRRTRTVGGVWMIDQRPLAEAFLVERDRLLRHLRARGAADMAEDLLQELWLKVDAELDVTALNPVAYLHRMAHNLMLDRARSDARRVARERTYDEGSVATRPPGDPLQALLVRERLQQVAAVLGVLGPRTEQIVRLHRLDGVPQKAIADQLGISLSAVEKHLQKAYRALAGLAADRVEPAVSALPVEHSA